MLSSSFYDVIKCFFYVMPDLQLTLIIFYERCDLSYELA